MRTQQLILGFLLIVTGGVGCKPSSVVFPDAAPLIAGVYKATTYFGSDTLRYPIQGQNLTLTLTSLSRDSVRVELEAASSDKYSLGGSRRYETLPIYQGVTNAVINKRHQACIGYQVDLHSAPNANRTDQFLRMTCDNVGAIDYYYKPMSGEGLVIVRFEKP